MNTPDFRYERELWDKGLTIVGGADEVGRGCFAGPVVASAVAFAPHTTLAFSRGLRPRVERASLRGKPVRINDSKKLTKLQRERGALWIKKNALTYGIGVGSASRVNKFGIISATNFAFRSAIKNAQNRLNIRIQYLLIDAFYIPYIRGFHIPKNKAKKRLYNESSGVNQLAIVRGDAKSFSISAASIIAKVYRDTIMEKLGINPRYNKYDWNSNKGYGTKRHQEAILKYGVCRHHRTQFVETFLSNYKDKKVI